MKKNQEVNISTPTEAQQQSMNPYKFINIYKKRIQSRHEKRCRRMANTSLRTKPKTDNKRNVYNDKQELLSTNNKDASEQRMDDNKSFKL